MKNNNRQETSPFKALETHFLNAFHSGLYISATEMSNIGEKNGIDVPLKNREIIIKNLLNDANNNDKLPAVISDISALISERTQKLNDLSTNYPHAALFLKSLIQKTTSSNMLLQRQQRANPYE